jgi:hypothetical protein
VFKLSDTCGTFLLNTLHETELDIGRGTREQERERGAVRSLSAVGGAEDVADPVDVDYYLELSAQERVRSWVWIRTGRVERNRCL